MFPAFALQRNVRQRGDRAKKAKWWPGTDCEGRMPKRTPEAGRRPSHRMWRVIERQLSGSIPAWEPGPGANHQGSRHQLMVAGDGLRRQDAEANAEGGPQAEPQDVASHRTAAFRFDSSVGA
jgi:hypothetical protein